MILGFSVVNVLDAAKPAHALIKRPSKLIAQAGKETGKSKTIDAMAAIIAAHLAIFLNSVGELLFIRAASILNILSILPNFLCCGPIVIYSISSSDIWVL